MIKSFYFLYWEVTGRHIARDWCTIYFETPDFKGFSFADKWPKNWDDKGIVGEIQVPAC